MNVLRSLLSPSDRASLLFRTAGQSRRFGKVARNILLALHSSDVSRGATFGARLRLPHPINIVIGEGCAIGDDVTICQNVTLGHTRSGGYPTIGNRVTIFPGAIIVGEVRIGDDAIIGPHSLVVKDVPAKSSTRAPLAVILTPNE